MFNKLYERHHETTNNMLHVRFKDRAVFILYLFQSLSIYINDFVMTIKALDKGLVFDWQGKDDEHTRTIIC